MATTALDFSADGVGPRVCVLHMRDSIQFSSVRVVEEKKTSGAKKDSSTLHCRKIPTTIGSFLLFLGFEKFAFPEFHLEFFSGFYGIYRESPSELSIISS